MRQTQPQQPTRQVTPTQPMRQTTPSQTMRPIQVPQPERSAPIQTAPEISEDTEQNQPQEQRIAPARQRMPMMEQSQQVCEPQTFMGERPNECQTPDGVPGSQILFFEPYTLNDLFERFAYTVTDDFMLHGYHRFGHLGVLHRNNRYILGVPGIYCKREEMFATRSGFHNFFPKGGNPLKYGDFGYWYTSIEYLK